MDGKRWRLTLGERMLVGKVLYRRVGRSGERVRRAIVLVSTVSKTADVVGILAYSFQASRSVHLVVYDLSDCLDLPPAVPGRV